MYIRLVQVTAPFELSSPAPQDDSVTFQTGPDIVVRAQFINHGALPNAQDSNFRGVSANWPVFALARDLGKVNSASTSATAVFAVGHVRDPAVQYITANNGVQQRSSLFMSQASPIYSAVSRSSNIDLTSHQWPSLWTA